MRSSTYLTGQESWWSMKMIDLEESDMQAKGRAEQASDIWTWGSCREPQLDRGVCVCGCVIVWRWALAWRWRDGVAPRTDVGT
jgi:hypothetical protein